MRNCHLEKRKQIKRRSLGGLRLFAQKDSLFSRADGKSPPQSAKTFPGNFLSGAWRAYRGEQQKESWERRLGKRKNEKKRGFREEALGETRQRKKSFKRTRMERKIRGKGVFFKSRLEKAEGKGRERFPKGHRKDKDRRLT